MPHLLVAMPHLAMPTDSAHQRSWRLHDGHLLAELDVLSGFDADGQIAALRNASELYLDIGINTEPTMPGVTRGSPRHARFPAPNADTFYLGFEPLVDKWAVNVARGVQKATHVPLGTVQLPKFERRASALMVPLAIADRRNEPTTIHVSAIDGCSSLNLQRPPAQLISGGWNVSGTMLAKGCGGTLETRRVPTVTLAVVLREWLGGRPVEFIHIDVQGAELDVLRSAGPRLARQVRSFMVEVPAPSCATLTEGAPSCSQVFAAIEELGFVAEEAYMWNGVPQNLKRGFGCDAVPWSRWNSKCEFDIMFTRATERRSLGQERPPPADSAAVEDASRRCMVEPAALGMSYACPPLLVDTMVDTPLNRPSSPPAPRGGGPKEDAPIRPKGRWWLTASLASRAPLSCHGCIAA